MSQNRAAHDIGMYLTTDGFWHLLKPRALAPMTVRVAAIRSLFRYASLRHPDHAALIERVLAIPPKRFDRRLVTFLTEPEISALLVERPAENLSVRRQCALLNLARSGVYGVGGLALQSGYAGIYSVRQMPTSCPWVGP